MEGHTLQKIPRISPKKRVVAKRHKRTVSEILKESYRRYSWDDESREAIRQCLKK